MVPGNQQGFQSCRSTETTILNPVNYIEKFNKKVDYFIAVFPDIAYAIKPQHHKEILLAKGVEGKIVEWYHSHIIERLLILEANNPKVKTCVNTVLNLNLNLIYSGFVS